jgi:membrane protein DedA with SNARE-associated domain
MHEFIIEFINQYGYLGVFSLITLENIFPPIPSEIILTFSGFATSYTTMNAWLAIAAATAGSLVGAAALYLLGRFLSEERLKKLFDSRLGRLLHLRSGDVTRAMQWFERRGPRAVFLCRFVPIVRSLISIPAGSAKMKPGVFFPLTAAGTVIWNTALVFLGRAAGSAWEKVAHYFDTYSIIALCALLLVAAIILAKYIKRRFLNK